MNTYSQEDVMAIIEERDVKFIRLAFCDIFGQLKNISISPSALEKAFTDGIGFDASAIRGFLNIEDSDLLLFPDATTFDILPWRPSHSRVARLYCDIKHTDGTPFEGDARYILKQKEKEFLDKGIDIKIGSELEFYLFKTDEEGNATFETMDNASYFDIAPLDKGENIRREICITMEEMGLPFQSSHHEKGPGQNEVVFKHSPLLDAADKIITFKTIVKTISHRAGLFASFLPKPLLDQNGSGFHINISSSLLQKDEKAQEYMIAGILKYIREITIFLNPIANSYERLGAFDAPQTLDWGTGNRNLLIRVPKRDNQADLRIEVRSPDPSCNPYLATALLVSAAVKGYEEKMLLKNTRNEKSLPQSIKEAIKEAKDSKFIKSIITPHLFDCFLKAKEADIKTIENSNNLKQKAIEMEFIVT